jgi:hypothetical protein
MPRDRGADIRHMFWPVAALAGFILGFAIVYGSIAEARVASYRDAKKPDSPA